MIGSDLQLAALQNSRKSIEKEVTVGKFQEPPKLFLLVFILFSTVLLS